MGKLDQIVFRQARQRVSAVGFLYKLCGSSQPSIIQGSDGAFYVVKFNGFPGRQGLANEVVGTELIQSAGLPAPDWAAIEVSDEFMDGNRGLWFRNENCSIRPLAGIHFGSRLVEAPEDDARIRLFRVHGSGGSQTARIFWACWCWIFGRTAIADKLYF